MENPADIETFTYWATHPQELEAADLPGLEATAAHYPYCQLVHILAAKCAAQSAPSQVPAWLPRAAAYAVNRYALKNLLSNEQEWNSRLITRLTAPSLFRAASPPAVPDLAAPAPEGLFAPAGEEDRQEGDNEMLVNEAVHESLSRMQQPPAELPDPPAAGAPPSETGDQKKIIEKFFETIKSSGPNRIVIDESDHFEDLSQRNQAGAAGEFATEALARIFVRQGKIDKAIQIYQQLILKKPEKIDYFAEKIKELK